LDDRVARLLDKQEIEEVVLRYCRGIDRRDLEMVRDCYHPDGTDEHGSFSGTIDEYLVWVDGLLEKYRFTMHVIGNVLIELEAGGERAVAESYGVSIHGSDDPRPYLNMATGFRYVDRFERRGGPWKIAERFAVAEWSIAIPTEVWWNIPDSHRKGQRDASDVIYTLLASLAGGNRAS